MINVKFIGKCLLVEENGKKILAVGDLHLGYEEMMNKSGVYVSRVMYGEMMNNFDSIFNKIEKVDEIVLLGDVKHQFSENLDQEWNDILRLFDYLAGKAKKIIVTRGNHDNYLRNIAVKKKVDVLDYYVSGKYCFVHGDKKYSEMDDKKIECWIMGHAHPAVKINDGFKVEKYKCFLEGKYNGREIIILPSFIELNEGSDPRENENKMAWDFDFNKFNVKVVGDKLEVLDFGKLGKMK